MANFNFNKVILAGRISGEIDYRETSQGSTVALFSIAVNRKTSQGQEADFFNVSAWGQTADVVANYFDKGHSICIEGTLKVRKWEDDEGNTRSKVEIVANTVSFVDSKKDIEDEDENKSVKKVSKSSSKASTSKTTANGSKTSKTGSKTAKPRFEEIEDEDDLPF